MIVLLKIIPLHRYVCNEYANMELQYTTEKSNVHKLFYCTAIRYSLLTVALFFNTCAWYNRNFCVHFCIYVCIFFQIHASFNAHMNGYIPVSMFLLLLTTRCKETLLYVFHSRIAAVSVVSFKSTIDIHIQTNTFK